MQALERFLQDIERRALRIAQYGVGNRDDALDIVQEAMLKLAQSYAHKPDNEWAPLFYRILQSRIMDFHRRNKVRNRFRIWLRMDDPDASGDPIQNQADPAEPHPERGVQALEFSDDLERSIRDLPLRQQQALLLRLWEGLDVASTAKAMGCSQGSVKTHYSRAVHRLRGQLSAHHNLD